MGVVRQARESNMELLRIVSMLMVLLLHANFLVFGTPTAADATCQPVATFLRLFFESVSIVGVNLFVFISGWYGIKAKVSRIAAFLFQVFFFVAVCYGAEVVVLGTNTFSFSYLFHLLRMDSYWFAQAYLILYVLSPALNKLNIRRIATTCFSSSRCSLFRLCLVGLAMDGTEVTATLRSPFCSSIFSPHTSEDAACCNRSPAAVCSSWPSV